MVVYIALLGILMTGALLSAWQILQGSAQISGRTVAQDEESFVLHKIDWALAGVKTITSPSIGTPYSSTLSLTKYDGTTVDIRLNNTVVEMRENGAAYLPISTSNVQVTALSFHYLSGTPIGIEAAVTINNSFVASTTKYVR